MTDNGSAYRSTIHAFACRSMGLRHLRTHRRPHGSLSHKTPIAHLNELNDVPGSYS